MAAAMSAAAAAAAARHPAAIFGVAGVLVFLGSAVVRLTPAALSPTQCHESEDRGIVLSEPAFMVAVVFFGYAEHYKAACVQRALTLSQPNCALIHRALAPMYVMGLVHASRGRLLTAYAVIVSVSVLAVLFVDHVPYPQRGMIDAGVAIGLGWAAAAIFALYVRALAGFGAPDVDPGLPEGIDYRAELAAADEELGAKEELRAAKPSAGRAVITRALMLLPLALVLMALLVVLQPPPPPSPPPPPLPLPPPPALEATASGSVIKGSIGAFCASFCVICPQLPSAQQASEEWYAATKRDGSVVACRPTYTREGKLCFCDDS